MHVIACSNMNMGEAEVEPKIYATDHHGVAFMLQVRAGLPLPQQIQVVTG